MKYLKTFENYDNFTDEIAEDLLPKLQQIRDEKGSFTSSDFDEYMKERGSDLKTIDLVASSLVNMGFDFDVEEDEGENDPLDFELKGKMY
jgi:hypothetical protein